MATRKPDKALAQRFAALMDAAQLSCPDISRRLRLSRNTPHLWLRGERYPSRALQPKLAKLLGCTIAALNGWPA